MLLQSCSRWQRQPHGDNAIDSKSTEIRENCQEQKTSSKKEKLYPTNHHIHLASTQQNKLRQRRFQGFSYSIVSVQPSAFSKTRKMYSLEALIHARSWVLCFLSG